MERTMEMALEGARLALAHWTTEGDAELAADAMARLGRLEAAARGDTPATWSSAEARSADVDGALDWLDADPRPDPEEAAVAGLVAAWNAMVAEGETTETEMAMGLVDQLGQATQGWSAGMEEDAEANPELAALVGLAEGMDDEEWDTAWERWEAVEQEAARRWLADHPEAAEAAREEMGTEEAPTPEEPTQPSNAVGRRLAGILARAAEEAEEMGEPEDAERARRLANRLESGAATEAEWLEAMDWVDPD